MHLKSIVYWAATGVLASGVLIGGVAELTRQQASLDSVARLGYPPYLLTILGFWKVPGALVLLIPGLPRIKEWAYAGIFFEMTGAVASHLMHGDSAIYVILPTFFAFLVIVSWALRPRSRMLGVLVAPADVTRSGASLMVSGASAHSADGGPSAR